MRVYTIGMDLQMVKTDLKCVTPRCRWKQTMFMAQGVPLKFLRCGKGHFGLQVIKSYPDDKENYKMEII